MGGKRLSESTMAHAKLEILVNYYLADMQRRGCTGDSVTPWPTLWTRDVVMTALLQRYIDDLQLRNNIAYHAYLPSAQRVRETPED